jgi:transcriptional regulator with XRE-family HTH domain
LPSDASYRKFPAASSDSGGQEVANEIDVIVGQRIRTQRIAKGWSQGRLADALGITFQQVQKYEKGVNRISASRLQAVARLFGVEPATLFPSDEPVIDMPMVTHEIVRLNAAFMSIRDSALRVRILDLVAAFADAADGKTAEDTGET